MVLNTAIAITLDTDWVPQQIIDYVIDILSSYGLKVTFFCSSEADTYGHEVGIHPFFRNHDKWVQTICQLLKMYPNAKGVRAHRHLISSEILFELNKRGLEYDSSYLMPGVNNITPYFVVKNIVEFPIYFEDDVHLRYSNNFFLSEKMLMGPRNSLRVFDFHPIHVYLNTNTFALYLKAKRVYHDPEELNKFRHAGRGIATLFISLLEYIRRNDLRTYLLSDLNRIFRRKITKRHNPKI